MRIYDRVWALAAFMSIIAFVNVYFLAAKVFAGATVVFMIMSMYDAIENKKEDD